MVHLEYARTSAEHPTHLAVCLQLGETESAPPNPGELSVWRLTLESVPAAALKVVGVNSGWVLFIMHQAVIVANTAASDRTVLLMA